MTHTRRHSRRSSPLARYGFLALTLLALLTNQLAPALLAATATAYAWKGHRTR
ncbi:hypothetical protein YUMDRAFT_06073 [Streptomyces sp. OspMP-M45]|nr:hypothetical protein YUMDRAFT_06073 [Streptomyces sp. OspMP-M45]